MSRRRQFAQPEPVVHGYWVHSDPEPSPPSVGSNPTITPALRHHQGDHAHILGDTPCPGPCNREFRAAEQNAETEYHLAHVEQRDPDPAVMNHDVVFHPARPAWCVDDVHVERDQVIVDRRGCTGRVAADLAAIPDLAGNLAPGALNTPRDITGRHGSKASQPTASPGWDEADELIRWAITLEDQLRERLGHETRGEHWRTLGDAIRYLTAYSTPLLTGPAAVPVGFKIMRVRRQLEQGTGQDRLVHRLPGLCMVCDRKSLQRKDGQELVKCRACGATWDWDHYQQLSKAYADDVRRRGA